MPLMGILLWLLLPVAIDDPPVPPQGEAQVELERAEQLVRAGRHDKAVDVYERIARRWPETAAGQLAERRAAPNAFLGWSDIVRHGPSSNRVDIVVMGDGYKLKQQSEFDDIADDIPRVFERSPIFGEYFSYLNLLRANLRSEESGPTGYGRETSTVLGGYVLETSLVGNVAVSPERVREMLIQVPGQDGLAIAVVQRGVAGTGRAGLATIGGRDFNLLLHEWGHAFANLADEYSIDIGINLSSFREAPNVSASEDPDATPWSHWIAAGARGIGAYKGGLGRLNGVWHPQASGCVMNNGEKFFCVVCREVLVLRIYEFVDPIESVTLVDEPEFDLTEALRRSEAFEIELTVMRPEKHTLEVRWWLLPAVAAPRPLRNSAGLRSTRGPLVPITAKPTSQSKGNKKGVHRFRVNPAKLDPGRYRLVCRVRDTTELRGDKLPWVLRDPAGLLESERSFRIEVLATD